MYIWFGFVPPFNWVIKHCITLLQMIVSRFNKGVENSNIYHKDTMSLFFINRVPTAHIRYQQFN